MSLDRISEDNGKETIKLNPDSGGAFHLLDSHEGQVNREPQAGHLEQGTAFSDPGREICPLRGL